MNRRALACVALLMGCGPNQPPRLLSVNGVAFTTTGNVEVNADWYAAFGFIPGEPFEITFEVDDPDGDVVRVWWPRSPPGVAPDPDALTWTWDVPGYFYDTPSAAIVLQDDDPDQPRMASGYLPLFPVGLYEDTGDVPTQ